MVFRGLEGVGLMKNGGWGGFGIGFGALGCLLEGLGGVWLGLGAFHALGSSVEELQISEYLVNGG